MKIYKSINKCRISKKKDLINIAKFPDMGLTGTFPNNFNKKIIITPFNIVFSKSSKLLQLRHNYKSGILYGSNYGYRSGLNPVMVSHLKEKYIKLRKILKFKSNQNILDIGSNDGTFLNFFPKNLNKYAIDPTINKFKKFYEKKTYKISSTFFKASKKIEKKKFSLITAIAMFYDLEDPIENLKKIKKLLTDDGIFHMEVAYLPKILSKFSYDTFCQEHYEYYSLLSLNYMVKKLNMEISTFGFNDINGGSIWLNIKKKSKKNNINKKLKIFLKKEIKQNIHKVSTYKNYFRKVFKHANDLNKLIVKYVKNKKIIFGYGASTKGNVLLQLSNLNYKHIKNIVDINPYKFGRFTPVSKIKIIKQENLKNKKIDYILLLIWHLKDHSIKQIKKLNKKVKIILPFPKIKVI